MPVRPAIRAGFDYPTAQSPPASGDCAGKKLSKEQLTGIANRISAALVEGYSDNALEVDVNITVSSLPKDAKQSDHVFALYEEGDLPKPDKFGSKMPEKTAGAAAFGQKGIVLSKAILGDSPTSDENNQFYGTGLSADGKSTLERTSAHEFGHTMGLGHESAAPNTLMRQSIDPKPGMKIDPVQSKEMIRNIENCNVNGKRRFYL